jgi:hypothetical protein
MPKVALATYFVDLDMTLIDSRARYELAGKEPNRSKSQEAYSKWLHTVQSEESLAQDKLFLPVTYAIRAIAAEGHQVVFLTAREESWRPVTEKVLTKSGFGHYPLVMRPDGDTQKSGAYKTGVLKSFLEKFPNEWAIMVDDDPDGLLEKKQKQVGFTLLKTFIGGPNAD